MRPASAPSSRLTPTPVSYTLVTPEGVYTFFNHPRPFCYTYAIPGAWASAPEADLYLARQGRGFAGVLFLLAGDLAGVERTTADPDCYWSLLEDLLKTALGER